MAIKAWYTLVCLTLADTSLKHSSTSGDQPQFPSVHPKMRDLMVKRTEEWVRNPAEKLMVLTERIKAVASHSNWRVRMAMCDWATELLTHCQR